MGYTNRSPRLHPAVRTPFGHPSRHHISCYAQPPAAIPAHRPVDTTGLRDDDKNDYMTAYLPDYLLSFSFAPNRIDPYLAHVRMTTPHTPLGIAPHVPPWALTP